jgi:hypothetical protein
MKVNFKELPVYTSIRKDKTEKVDISEVVADTIYKNVGGVVAHSLALRIYNDGEVELNEKECEIVRMVADGFVGIIADSIKDKLSS